METFLGRRITIPTGQGVINAVKGGGIKTHWQQQRADGFANFYGKTTKNHTRSIMKYGTTNSLYNGTFLPYNYEHGADKKGDDYARSKGYIRVH